MLGIRKFKQTYKKFRGFRLLNKADSKFGSPQFLY